MTETKDWGRCLLGGFRPRLSGQLIRPSDRGLATPQADKGQLVCWDCGRRAPTGLVEIRASVAVRLDLPRACDSCRYVIPHGHQMRACTACNTTTCYDCRPDDDACPACLEADVEAAEQSFINDQNEED